MKRKPASQGCVNLIFVLLSILARCWMLRCKVYSATCDGETVGGCLIFSCYCHGNGEGIESTGCRGNGDSSMTYTDDHFFFFFHMM